MIRVRSGSAACVSSARILRTYFRMFLATFRRC